MDSCTIRANAKINLSLDVTGKRPDGYHNVRMVMQSVNLHDTITVSLAERGINLQCNTGRVPLDNRNLAYRAAELFLEETGLGCGVNIKITKRIPIAAGLAGGSADAAAVLNGLNQLLGTGLGKKRLCELGGRLGADVPFCIMGGTMLAERVGDSLSPLPGFSGLDIIIIRPRISVSTPWVYRNLRLDAIVRHPDTDLVIQAIESRDVWLLAQNMVNVLETVTIQEYGIIGQIKERLLELGAAGSLMSGSGPSVFGIFPDRQSAGNAWNKLDRRGMDCFLTSTA